MPAPVPRAPAFTVKEDIGLRRIGGSVDGWIGRL